jgi:hypothetical protein
MPEPAIVSQPQPTLAPPDFNNAVESREAIWKAVNEINGRCAERGRLCGERFEAAFAAIATGKVTSNGVEARLNRYVAYGTMVFKKALVPAAIIIALLFGRSDLAAKIEAVAKKVKDVPAQVVEATKEGQK